MCVQAFTQNRYLQHYGLLIAAALAMQDMGGRAAAAASVVKFFLTPSGGYSQRTGGWT